MYAERPGLHMLVEKEEEETCMIFVVLGGTPNRTASGEEEDCSSPEIRNC